MIETLPLSRWSRDVLVFGIVGALLLHLAAGWVLVFGWPSLDLPQPAPTVIEVEFVSPPVPPPPPAPPPQAPRAETPTPRLPMALPPPPVLEEAPVADVSRPTPAPGPESRRPGPAERPQGPAREAPARPAPEPPPPPAIIRGGSVAELPPVRRITPPSLIDDAPFRIGRADRAVGAGGATETRQRSEGDFVLGQVLPFWLIDYRSRRFRNVVLEGPFGLQADGTLSYPYGKGDPWQPEVLMANWPELQRPENESVRVALESFLRAVRAAQPFKLPPNAPGAYPRRIRISFIMGDL